MSLASDALLLYVDACVRRDAGPSGLKGVICVGVRQNGATRWWIGRFDRTVTVEFNDALPAVYDAGLAVDGLTARWILGDADEPGALHLQTGNLVLLERFTRRYLGRLTPISIRGN